MLQVNKVSTCVNVDDSGFKEALLVSASTRGCRYLLKSRERTGSQLHADLLLCKMLKSHISRGVLTFIKYVKYRLRTMFQWSLHICVKTANRSAHSKKDLCCLKYIHNLYVSWRQVTAPPPHHHYKYMCSEVGSKNNNKRTDFAAWKENRWVLLTPEEGVVLPASLMLPAWGSRSLWKRIDETLTLLNLLFKHLEGERRQADSYLLI